MYRAALVFLAFALLSVAADAQCPEGDICCNAGLSAMEAKDWKSLYAVVSSAKGCDDGWIRGAYSDKVSTLLADRWDLLEQLHGIGESVPWFLEFVLEHLDGAVPADRLAKIRHLATTECVKEYADLCDTIAKRSR